ncbi:glycoside hydrolase family 130 protein [Chryseobacterium gotjawalense]|uniref:Glycoside hydrolase family 130 protein n=1 Tax=Chryseobacterium gotjawalense TaxID=3042315 RepID=A0ABY8RG19_9FLAO|nr:glycoside hydrolase family 130 protein [Chryseobacterium sp. wdc7]WHF52920.1 glycoside hydrolase family 130 protein [Chryseobacterium sp. wdc7]
MRVPVTRKQLHFLPDSSRVVARYFMNGDSATKDTLALVFAMSECEVHTALNQTLREFAYRHRHITFLFKKHYNNVIGIIEQMQVNANEISEERKLLIGAYLTMEYSLESTAFFNPSIIPDVDQTYLEKGEKRVIISFRATGEGHISSIVFRRAILDRNNDLHLMSIGKSMDMAEVLQKTSYHKGRFVKKMQEMKIPDKYYTDIVANLPNHFDYATLKNSVDSTLKDATISTDRRIALEEIAWLLESYYDIEFQHDSDISERVIYPISESESNGIEDARFVQFVDDDGSVKFYATYTAYNGHTILPKFLSTEDFCTFRIMPLRGKGAMGKNLAFFPRKIKGQYAMLSRIDGINNYIMFSDRNTLWDNPILLQKPKYAWEFSKIGNCGSPIWTEKGWLIITHGVGPMRRYCIGASLLDLDDPTKEIGRLEEPLLIPLANEREGYVPNVVYSCGSIIHNNYLILPYAVSDYSTTYAVVELAALFEGLKI